MKLLLVDTSDVKISSGGRKLKCCLHRDALFPMALKRKRDQKEGDEEEDMARAKLISKLRAELNAREDSRAIKMELELDEDGKCVHVQIELMFADAKNGIFKTLWDRSRSLFEISAEIKYAPDIEGELVDFASLKGMYSGIWGEENARHWVCVGSVGTDKVSFDQEPRLHVKLVAELPNRCNAKCNAFLIPAGMKILEKGLFTDMIISAKNGSEIKCHRSFLYGCSRFFQSKLERWADESTIPRVDMTGVTERAVWPFLRYIYYEDLDEPMEDISVAFELLHLSHEYEVEKLEAEMATLLERKNDEDFNVEMDFDIYLLVRSIKYAAKLRIKTAEILKSKIDELKLLKGFNDLFDRPSRSNSTIAKQLFLDLAEFT